MTGYTQLSADFNGDGVVEASSVCHLAGEVYVAMMAENRCPLPDFPTMYTLSEPLRTSSNENSDYRFLLYGQAAALNREMPAAKLVEKLVEEARDTNRRRISSVPGRLRPSGHGALGIGVPEAEVLRA